MFFISMHIYKHDATITKDMFTRNNIFLLLIYTCANYLKQNSETYILNIKNLIYNKLMNIYSL